MHIWLTIMHRTDLPSLLKSAILYCTLLSTGMLWQMNALMSASRSVLSRTVRMSLTL